jgi:tetratricopeptide (TPR) repeat protein
MRSTAILISIFALSQQIIGQSVSPARSPLEATVWGVVYDTPGTKAVRVTPDVTYLKDGRSDLKLDIYLPPDQKAGALRPAVIFLNAIGDRPGDKVKSWEIYKSWPRLVAAHDMVGIAMDADGTRIQDSLKALFDFLGRDGAKHGIDADRLGVYAASANVTQSSIYLMGENASKGIKAAALYYGGAPQGNLRRDLPVLFILAEGDLPGGLGQQAIPLWQRVTESRAPWTMVFASRMPHAFDAFEDNDESRRLVQQTIAFWRTHLEPTPQPPWKPSAAREIVAATYGSDYARTAGLLTKYLAENPNDAHGHVLLGRNLQQLRRFDEAAAAFERAAAIAPNDPRAASGLGQVRLGQKRYDEAARLLANAIDNGFRNSMLYGQLAFAQLFLNRNEEAIKNYERSFEMGIPPGANTRGVAYYNMACAYARLKQSDKAFEMLGKAIDEGFANRETLEKDEDLAALRSDPRFAALTSRIPKTTTP